ncbi:hypothetical protein Pst134EA_003284 [Puccinia striiformis f. sp. tritici]|uniref:hypothetical protein n=1 Tax=Puccinia striiformis f. sp. tritici TaxID=168172 RepID=UPI002007C94C|nr:hypothetical protein Pst134EA_003284 [Puccinia striiformis f. sp. tritici]KAH9472680.1 hypothetical protein Pst134EA_003284 [Puccinia striiformis f. sp. tritici]
MNRPRHGGNNSKPSGEKAQLVLAYQELGNELHSTQLKVIGNYTLGRVIGEGSFGTVRLGIHRLTGSRVAVKHIPKSSSPPLLTREIHHHRRLHHPNVVQLYEVIATEHSIWLITELCSGGELFDYLVEKTRFTEFEARRLFGQICLGLGYVHGRGVVHRDIKLENVLLDERCNPKLADFGFGREFEPRKLLDTFCGTTGYAAPEMLAGKKYLGEEVDIWSLGIILYALLTGSLPFDDDDEDVMKSMIIAGYFEMPNFLSNEACNLIQSILQQDPKARPSIEKILSHPWFTTPPLQHTFSEDEPLSRPSPIIEEAQQLIKSPSTSLSTLASADQLHQASSKGSQLIPSNHPNKSSHSVFDSDTSGPSSKESGLSVSSSRSSTSSPVTSEDLPAQMSAIPDLGLSSSDRSAGSSKFTTPSAAQPLSMLKHSNSSHSTIKNSQPSIPHNPLQYLPTHAEDESDATPLELRNDGSNVTPNSQRGPGPSSQSSNPSNLNSRAGSSKPRPLSILSSLPSSLAHTQIRTPSRTKRRSGGSTLSERIGPFEDGAPSDFATPVTNQARLSTSSFMTVVIDYVGALKATTQAPLLSPDDLIYLKSLSALGFDTGQIIHSVQSYACDTSGALLWLLKRKKEKLNPNRDDLERDSNFAVNKDPFNTHGPVELQSTDSLALESLSPTSVVSSTSIPPPSKASLSIISPPDDSSPTSLKSITEPITSLKKQASPSKTKLTITSPPKVEPMLNLVKIEKEAGTENPIISGHRSYLNLKANFGSSKNNPVTTPTINLYDDCSSTSSARLDAVSGSEKETPCITVDLAVPGKKSTADLRKRSQSVSMLHRATHALGTKKLADDKHSKSRSREGSSTTDGEEKHAQEKVSKKDMKAREKEIRMEEHTKSSGSLPLSGLFSRKTLLLPSLPPLPGSLMLHQSSGGSEKLADKGGHRAKELDAPTDALSRPSSPSKTHETPSKSKDDGDTSFSNALLANDQFISTTPSLSGSSSSIKMTTPNMLYDHLDSFSTPMPLSPSGKTNVTGSTSKTDEWRSLKETSPVASSSAEGASAHRQSPSESETLKASRPKPQKGNLFSNFRLWFNEDRRKRKQNMAMIANYGHPVKSPTRIGSQNHSPNGGAGGSVASSSLASDLPSRKVNLDLQTMRSASGSVLVHRRTSKGSRRSSLQSTRQLSLELHNATKATNKRRSGSSRASFGSITDARTPGSEPGSHASLSHHARGSLEGSGRTRRHDAHGCHGSISSAGSRRSTVALQLLTPHSSSSAMGYPRRTSGAGTTVRRVTAPVGSSSSSSRHRQHRAASTTSSVRTSMSSDDGIQMLNRRSSGGTEDHRLHSPNNVYDVEETIEEEDDGSEENGGKETDKSVIAVKTDAARQSAFQKLSGDISDNNQARLSLEGPGTHQGAGGSGTRTIFMAHKPHSVFGTPNQAFYARSNQSPVTSKYNTAYGTGNGSVLAYVNLMNSIADGPSSSRKSGSTPKLRDVFASKAKEDGEWVDMDDDDDECARYEGGIGQGVKSRNHILKNDRSGSSGLELKPATSNSLIKDSINNNPTSSLGSIIPSSSLNVSNNNPNPVASVTSLGNSPTAAALIGNWRGGNPRVTPTFKSVAIEEEEEEE